MTETRRTIRSGTGDAVMNPRHNLELVGALMVGSQIMESEQVAKGMDALIALGVPPELIALGGIVLIAIARIASFVARLRRNTGDPT